jgi:hypothetical protein
MNHVFDGNLPSEILGILAKAPLEININNSALLLLGDWKGNPPDNIAYKITPRDHYMYMVLNQRRIPISAG